MIHFTKKKSAKLPLHQNDVGAKDIVCLVTVTM